ncbi:hypothetical protein A1O3_08982 [Capronia epimyces CBS 606.96]|uniref:Uncharacterized protein n=1 Tax=Capronia epimyces CBS 606.96 TaxID=1182542 RepID=W9XC61_9EURO|nr:uncharacterized protein A1O3_08982 [Capronia epimyces CBS 606.96]EXJ77823.1 hypothetical protein A1O3_08982 [Capronia epimyces CBS 606.96]
MSARTILQDRKEGDMKDRNLFEEHENQPPPAYVYQHDSTSEAMNASPVQAHPAQVPCRRFQLQYTNWKAKTVRVTDTDNGTEVYTADLRWQKPNMVIRTRSPIATDIEIATVVFHCLKTDIDVGINGANLTLHHRGIFSASYSYSSQIYPSQSFKWKGKNRWRTMDFECVHEDDGVTVARFSAANWSRTRIGQIEMFGQQLVDNKMFMDELMVTGLAVVIQLMVWQTGAAAIS